MEEVNPRISLACSSKHPQTDGFHRTFYELVECNSKEITMVDREAKRLEKEKQNREQYEQWQELSKAHWNHWRAWGSWFSWGSPIGLGLWFVLMAAAAAILIVAIKL